MRIFLMFVLSGSALILGACQSAGVQSADAGDAHHLVVSGGQSRYSVDVPGRATADVRDEGAYSLTGDAPQDGAHPHAVDTSSFVRHSTNGNF
jgi:hypothetical protein